MLGWWHPLQGATGAAPSADTQAEERGTRQGLNGCHCNSNLRGEECSLCAGPTAALCHTTSSQAEAWGRHADVNNDPTWEGEA